MNNQIELKNVSKVFRKKRVLNQLNIKMNIGEVHGLTGINGSGKTMLLRLLAGLIKPSEGSISISDKQISLGRLPVKVGAMIENPNFINEFTGYQNLEILSLLD